MAGGTSPSEYNESLLILYLTTWFLAWLIEPPEKIDSAYRIPDVTDATEYQS